MKYHTDVSLPFYVLDIIVFLNALPLVSKCNDYQKPERQWRTSPAPRAPPWALCSHKNVSYLDNSFVLHLYCTAFNEVVHNHLKACKSFLFCVLPRKLSAAFSFILLAQVITSFSYAKINLTHIHWFLRKRNCRHQIIPKMHLIPSVLLIVCEELDSTLVQTSASPSLQLKCYFPVNITRFLFYSLKKLTTFKRCHLFY